MYINLKKPKKLSSFYKIEIVIEAYKKGICTCCWTKEGVVRYPTSENRPREYTVRGITFLGYVCESCVHHKKELAPQVSRDYNNSQWLDQARTIAREQSLDSLS